MKFAVENASVFQDENGDKFNLSQAKGESSTPYSDATKVSHRFLCVTH